MNPVLDGGAASLSCISTCWAGSMRSHTRSGGLARRFSRTTATALVTYIRALRPHQRGTELARPGMDTLHKGN